MNQWPNFVNLLRNEFIGYGIASCCEWLACNNIDVLEQSCVLSFTNIWLTKGNPYKFRKHPKIKWLDGGMESLTSGLPVHCSTNWTNVANFRMLLIACMNVTCFIVML